MATSPTKLKPLATAATETSSTIVSGQRSNEMFFAVVGPVGAGGSRVLKSLERACIAAGYECFPVKASTLIRDWAEQNGKPVPPTERTTLETVVALQDLGDNMRTTDPSAVARAMVVSIAKLRATAMGEAYVPKKPVVPDGKKRAYMLESIRHPAEVSLLRRTYGVSFALIGVVCEETRRKSRILGKYFTVPERFDPRNVEKANIFIARDANDPRASWGQHVTDAFFEADFFIDNSANDEEDKNQLLDEPLARLVSIVSHNRIIRPTIEETAMHHAHSARVRSACLSRQVGAALVDADGTVVATGVNEVPRAGGGVYGESFKNSKPPRDHRCAFVSATPFCSNNREQNKIIDELIAAVPALAEQVDRPSLIATIRKTRLGGLIEFSRAVHAEMDALLSAGREGLSTIGTRLFVTTFPCHYCARHIVSAGVFEVHYIEPFPKSLAQQLHSDAIEVDPAQWVSPVRFEAERPEKGGEQAGSVGQPKVLFHPFVGVAPRSYIRAFEETWRLKNKVTGDFQMEPPEWGEDWKSMTIGYPELEALLETAK